MMEMNTLLTPSAPSEFTFNTLRVGLRYIRTLISA